MSALSTLAESVAAHTRTQPHKIGARDSQRELTLRRARLPDQQAV
jgi:hypothetical protein